MSVHNLRARQVTGRSSQAYSASSASAAARLALAATLGGHDGCVNRLAWDEAGEWLASVSDDRSIIVRPLEACTGTNHDTPGAPSTTGATRVATQHLGNIFGVEFLPGSGGCGGTPDKVVTGAMDGTVQLHALGGGGGGGTTPPSPPGSPAAALRRRAGGGGPGPAPASTMPTLRGATLAVLDCHTGRVKHVAVSPAAAPACFYSASEDGTARLFDERDPGLMPASGRWDAAEGGGGGVRPFTAPNVLAAPLPAGGGGARGGGGGGRGGGSRVPLKAIAFCPARPWLFAVAADDAFLRVYDARAAGPASPTAAARRAPLEALAPPHLIASPAAARGAASTFVAWSADCAGRAGPALLGNYSGAGVWRFDGVGSGRGADGDGDDAAGTVPPPGWPPHAPPDHHSAAAAPPPWAWRPHPRAWARPRPPAARPASQPADSDEEDEAAMLAGGPGAAAVLVAHARTLLDRGWAGDAWSAVAHAAAAVHEATAGPDAGNRPDAGNPRLERQALAAMGDALAALGVREGGRAAHAAAASAAGGGGSEQARPPPPPAWVWEGSAAAAGADADARRAGWPGGRLPTARYLGALNEQTDIKEARFYGPAGDPFSAAAPRPGGGGCVVAGSDDGLALVWPALPSGPHLRDPVAGSPPLVALEGDDDITNCVLPHPTLPLLATSGLGETVRVWAPGGGGGGGDDDGDGDGSEDGGGGRGARAAAAAARAARPASLPAAFPMSVELMRVVSDNAARTAPNLGGRGGPGTLRHARAAGQAMLAAGGGGRGATIDIRDLGALVDQDPALLMAILQRAAAEEVAGRGRGGGGGGGGENGGEEDDDEGEEEEEEEGRGGQPECRVS